MSNGCCLTWFKWVNSIFLVTLIIQTAKMKKKKKRPWKLELENLFTQMTLTIAGLSRMWARRRKSCRLWTHVSLFIQKPLQDPSSIFRIRVNTHRDRFLNYQTVIFLKSIRWTSIKIFHSRRKNKTWAQLQMRLDPKGRVRRNVWYL